ncbi:MAG: YbaN family protein [Mobilitalea sp.]
MSLKKIFLILLGFTALLFGALGIFLPILPTTPFILLSAGCFSASSPKLSSLLQRNKYFGSYIENHNNKTGVPRKVKICSILYLWISLVISMLIINTMIMFIILTLVGTGVTVHLASLKNRE